MLLRGVCDREKRSHPANGQSSTLINCVYSGSLKHTSLEQSLLGQVRVRTAGDGQAGSLHLEVKRGDRLSASPSTACYFPGLSVTTCELSTPSQRLLCAPPMQELAERG